VATSTADIPQTRNGEELAASCFIDGAWIQGEGEAHANVINPATEVSLVRMRFASGRQVEAAIAAARRARDSGPWAELSARDRSLLLHRLTDLFEARRDEYVDLIISEVGSPRALAQAGQVGAAIDTFRWFADAAARGPVGGYEYGLPLHHQPFTSASLLRQEPIGVVAAITAYNFPLFLLARKLGGILASGCTGIVLPSERAPLTTYRFFEMMQEVEYPPGVANFVVGSKDAGVTLTSHHDVDMVSFTGSVAVGSAVMAQAAPTTKKVVLELGGKSPTIVLPGAEIDLLAGPSILRMTTATGQACGCTTRTFVSDSDYQDYVDAAGDFIGTLKVGDPRAADTALGPLIRAEQRASVEGYVDRALEAGGEIVAGGGRPGEPVGFYMNPALLSGLSNDSEIAQNELFGPVGVVIRYESVEDAIAQANESRYGLNAAVWGPTDQAIKVAQRIKSGSVAINGGGGPRPDAPWGGPRESGVGREGGEDGFRDFFEVKHIQWPVAGPARPD
jgi:aldehyde dehydrogenase (NAD+)/betaine-aldehyde dehydrogenase